MPTHQPVKGALYHSAPFDPVGDAILPLSKMEDDYPALHRRHVRKYAASPAVMDQFVEPLKCRWQDVVFLSPVHPRPLLDALRRSGRTIDPGAPWRLDAGQLDPTRTVIRLTRHGRSGHHPDPPTADDYLPWTTASLRAVNRVTVAAIERLENLGRDEPWLPWVDVPHVLHRGPIPFSAFRRGVDA